MRVEIGEDMNARTSAKYRKEKKVGEGTYANVYQGVEVATGRLVALKKIKVGDFKSGLDMSAIREVKALRELHHPNVIQLIDVFSHKTNLNLVLEFLDTDLEMVIKDTDLIFKPDDIKSWMLMTLRGLYHCHRSWVLHRDLKPNNLLIASDGQLKLADFGLARDYGDATANMTSQVVTRWYRAPELLFGAKKYGYAVDMWAVGCIFAELMLRTPYLPGDSDMDQLNTMFRALGTPTDEDWPNHTQLPDYVQFKQYPRTPLTTLFTATTPDSIDLMEKMLVYNPIKRITALEALNHPYFQNLPRPTAPKKLPKPALNINEGQVAEKRRLDPASVAPMANKGKGTRQSLQATPYSDAPTMLPGSSSAGKPARVKKPKPPKTMNPFAPPTLTEQGQTAVVEQPKAAPQKNTKKSRVIPVLDNPYDIKWPAVHFDRMMPEVIDQAIQCLTECRLLNKDPQGRADQPIRQNLDPTPDHPVIIAFGLSRVTRLLTNWIRPPTLSPKDQVTTAAAPRGRSLPATREATAMPSDPNGPTTATATTTTPPTPTARRYFVFVFRNNDETDAMVDPLATLVPLCGPSFSLIPLDPASRDRFRKTIAGAGDGPSQLTCFLLGDGFAAFDQFWHSAREEFAFPSLPWLDSLYRARMNLPAREGEEEEGGDGEGGVLVSSQPLAVLPPTQVKVFQIPVPSPQSKKQKKGARAHREKLSPEERLANREMRKKRKLENIASQPSGSEPAPPPKKNNKKQKLNKVAQKTDEIPQVLPLNKVGSGDVGP